MQTLVQLLPSTEGGLRYTMSMIKNCTVVLSNGNVVGMHQTEEEAKEHAMELTEEWQRHADCGSETHRPKIVVLPFNDWMQHESVVVF